MDLKASLWNFGPVKAAVKGTNNWKGQTRNATCTRILREVRLCKHCTRGISKNRMTNGNGDWSCANRLLLLSTSVSWTLNIDCSTPLPHSSSWTVKDWLGDRGVPEFDSAKRTPLPPLACGLAPGPLCNKRSLSKEESEEPGSHWTFGKMQAGLTTAHSHTPFNWFTAIAFPVNQQQTFSLKIHK